MKLIPNWRSVAFKSFSMWAIGVAQTGVAAILFWPNIPEDFKQYIEIRYVVWAISVSLVLGAIGRLVQQPTLHEPPKQGPQ